MDNPVAWLFAAIVLINFVKSRSPTSAHEETDVDPLALIRKGMDDSPTYLNDPRGGIRPIGSPWYH